MYIEAVPSRDSRPAFLLRESWREDGKIRARTLAMVGGMPALVSVLLGAVTTISGGAKERASFSVS